MATAKLLWWHIGLVAHDRDFKQLLFGVLPAVGKRAPLSADTTPTRSCTHRALVLADSIPNKIKMDDLLSIFKACLAYGIAWVNFGQHRSAFGTMLVQNVSYELLKNAAHEALTRL